MYKIITILPVVFMDAKFGLLPWKNIADWERS